MQQAAGSSNSYIISVDYLFGSLSKLKKPKQSAAIAFISESFDLHGREEFLSLFNRCCFISCPLFGIKCMLKHDKDRRRPFFESLCLLPTRLNKKHCLLFSFDSTNADKRFRLTKTPRPTAA